MIVTSRGDNQADMRPRAKRSQGDCPACVDGWIGGMRWATKLRWSPITLRCSAPARAGCDQVANGNGSAGKGPISCHYLASPDPAKKVVELEGWNGVVSRLSAEG